MIEIIIEELAGLVFEGMIEGSKSSKLPKPLRIILKVIVLAVFLAITFVCAVSAYAGFRDGNIGIGILMTVITLCVVGVVLFRILFKK